jgi:alpha-L-fucosidase
MKYKMQSKILALGIFCMVAFNCAMAQEDKYDQTAWVPPVISGPFKADADSLKNYEVPEWFRDAKFGVWSHWGPQAVPRAGDWYARMMYVPSTRQYEHHLKHYGHPSKTGYKDIIPLWKAEKFDPDALMKLYVKAGAKYFVSMGVHHDNFDLWNSRHHSWNAVLKGPKRDIVGAWKKSAKKYGLKFGVSEHLGASYSWFMTSHGYDEFWPHHGIGYDGEDPANSELYHSGKDKPYRNSKSWYTDNPESQKNWYLRISDLLEQYQPDLLYTDGGIPFGPIGKTLVANYYNNSVKKNKGKLEVVYNHKDIGSGEFIAEAGVQDVERGVMEGINPRAWQTDTSMGDWFYSEGFKYKTTSQIVHMLTDIVSKNGNMLLNVVQYPDGSLPPEAMTFLSEMADWIKVNGDAIYATRPWKIYGEGPTKTSAGHFKEEDNYTADDIRFTTKNNALYAITLAEATQQVRIMSLGGDSALLDKPIKSVKLLGHKQKLEWKQEKEALVIQLPKVLPSKFSSSFKIEFM